MRTRWTESTITSELLAAAEACGGTMPTEAELSAMKRQDLSAAMWRNGGRDHWRAKLCLQESPDAGRRPKERKRSWNEAAILEELTKVVSTLGRMPTSNELTEMGKCGLCGAICRSGGYDAWRARVGAFVDPNTAAAVGKRSERLAASMLTGLGFTVEAQSAGASFDLLVDGVRVDVKSGRYCGPSCGYVFSTRNMSDRRAQRCHVFLLTPMDEDHTQLSWYFIPEGVARVDTITITKNGKYEKYRDFVEAIIKHPARRAV